MANYYQEGNYEATILSHTFTPGKFGVQLVIEIEPHVEGNAYPRTVYLAFLDESGNPAKHIDETIAALAAMDYTDIPSRLDKQSKNPASLIGTEIKVTCKYNKDGKERWYINTPRAELEAVDSGTLRKLDALFGKQLKGAKPVDAKAATPMASKPGPKPSKAKTPPAAIEELHNDFDKGIDAANEALAEKTVGNDEIPF